MGTSPSFSASWNLASSARPRVPASLDDGRWSQAPRRPRSGSCPLIRSIANPAGLPIRRRTGPPPCRADRADLVLQPAPCAGAVSPPRLFRRRRTQRSHRLISVGESTGDVPDAVGPPRHRQPSGAAGDGGSSFPGARRRRRKQPATPAGHAATLLRGMFEMVADSAPSPRRARRRQIAGCSAWSLPVHVGRGSNSAPPPRREADPLAKVIVGTGGQPPIGGRPAACSGSRGHIFLARPPGEFARNACARALSARSSPSRSRQAPWRLQHFARSRCRGRSPLDLDRGDAALHLAQRCRDARSFRRARPPRALRSRRCRRRRARSLHMSRPRGAVQARLPDCRRIRWGVAIDHPGLIQAPWSCSTRFAYTGYLGARPPGRCPVLEPIAHSRRAERLRRRLVLVATFHREQPFPLLAFLSFLVVWALRDERKRSPSLDRDPALPVAIPWRAAGGGVGARADGPRAETIWRASERLGVFLVAGLESTFRPRPATSPCRRCFRAGLRNNRSLPSRSEAHGPILSSCSSATMRSPPGGARSGLPLERSA